MKSKIIRIDVDIIERLRKKFPDIASESDALIVRTALRKFLSS